MELENYIVDVPNWPKDGVVFKDISPLLASFEARSYTTNALVEQWRNTEYDKVLGFDARGFLFGVPVADAVQKPFVMARKPGKLPPPTVKTSYDLEYGSAELELPSSQIQPGDRILCIDDVLATGGTTMAAVELVSQLGAKVVGCGYVMELVFLEGRKILEDALGAGSVKSVIRYE